MTVLVKQAYNILPAARQLERERMMAYITPTSTRTSTNSCPTPEASKSWFQRPFAAFLSAIKDLMPPPAPRTHVASTATTGSRSRPTTRTIPPQTPWSEPLSEWSTPAVPDSVWCSQNFMLGAGMVIIQPSTDKFVLVYDSIDGHWFLPRGRKDLGESLEKTALREAYEESGYQVEFLPLHSPTCAPAPPDDPDAYLRLNTEPILVTLTSWSAGGRGRRKHPGEYLTSWYVGQIPEDAIYKPGTGMSNEQTYTSHLLTFGEAMAKLYGAEKRVLQYAWDVYHHTIKLEKMRRRERQEENQNQQSSSSRRSSKAATSDP